MVACQPSLLDSGDATIAWIVENLRHSWLSPILTAISDLGTTGAILFIMSFAYWCWNKEHSRTILYGILLSLLTNVWLKGLVMECRPPQQYHLSAIVDGSFSFPSGHAQVTILMWWGLAYYVRSKVLSALFIIIGILISLSRPYMGVHYVHDVVVGFALGVLLLVLCILNAKKDFLKLDRLPLWAQTIVIVLFLSLCNIAINNQIGHLAIASGILFGTWLGNRLEERFIQFVPTFNHPKLLQYALLGFGGALIIWKGGNVFTHALSAPYSYGFQYLQYALLGLWIAFGAPLFVKRCLDVK